MSNRVRVCEGSAARSRTRWGADAPNPDRLVQRAVAEPAQPRLPRSRAFFDRQMDAVAWSGWKALGPTWSG